MNSALRPMSTAEVLDRTFYLYRNHFALFAGIALVASLLSLLMRLALLSLFGAEALQGRPGVAGSVFLIIILVSILTYLVVHALASGATVYAVSLVHLERPATIHQSYTAIGPLFGRIFWIVASIFLRTLGMLIPVFLLFIVASVIVFGVMRGGGTAVALGATLLIGAMVFFITLACVLYMLAKYAFAVPACAVERLSAGDALNRSRFLTKKRIGRVLLVILLTGIIGIALNYLFQLPVSLYRNSFALAASRFQLSILELLWIYFAEFAAGILASPIATISIALLYYDERIRKEAFDLQLMMQALDPSAAPAASAATPGAIT